MKETARFENDMFKAHLHSARGIFSFSTFWNACCLRGGNAIFSFPLKSVIGIKQDELSPQGCFRGPEGGEKSARAAWLSASRTPSPVGARFKA